MNLRQNINGLNQLWFDSVPIERCGIQTISRFSSYEELLNLSKNHITTARELISERVRNINDNIHQHSIDVNIEKSNSAIINTIVRLREMYAVNTDVDDFELFERFGYETNIDYCYDTLSKLFFQISKQSNNSSIITDTIRNQIKVGDLPTFNNLHRLTSNSIVSNKMLGILFSNDYISNNEVTTYDNMWGTDTNLQQVYRTRTLGELLLEITNSDNKNTGKAYRQQIYMTYSGLRPKKTDYHKWNGLQVYDLDLKFWIQKSNGDIQKLKQELYSMLCDYNWFLWICTSASGNGLHIYTKTTAPHHIFTKPNQNELMCKYWHQVNYVTKQGIIYDCLYQLHNTNNNGILFNDYWKEVKGTLIREENNIRENKYLDNIVSRITAGIRLAYDSEPLVNHNFIDIHCGWLLTQTIDGYDYPETINRVLLRPSNKLIQNIDAYTSEAITNDEVDLSKFVTIGGDISNITVLPRHQINYVIRYNVVNTLNALFGVDGLPIAHQLLDSAGCNNVDEINAFYGTAISNSKEASKLGIEILRKCGIVKSVSEELTEVIDTSFKSQLKYQIEKSINTYIDDADFHLSSNEYLGTIKDKLLNAISGEYINIVLSPAGSGKTSLFKQLANEGKRILLVLPYISVIKNKIETDPEISKIFDMYYGSADIKDIQYGINAVTTFDKFSRSNYEKISKMFDYIVIDESHLLFTSSYRIEATSNVIKKIKDLFYISSNDPFAAKIILMTGTETGEEYYFNKVGQILRVYKPQLDKQMEFLICDDTLDATTRLSSKVTHLIEDGYKIMIPTNKGEIYSEKIIGMVEHLLGRPVKYGYYKRSNTEQEICRLIKEQNTVGDYEIILCSN